MIINSNLYRKQLKECSKEVIFEDIKEGSKFLITGSTGMLGSCIIDILMEASNHKNIQVYASGRSMNAIQRRFQDYLKRENFHFIKFDVVDTLESEVSFDFIIHAASNANPKLFATQPVETLTSNFLGMFNLFEYTRSNQCGRMLFVSSGEMYGIANENINGFSEEYSGYINYSDSRSCYPSGKRVAEVLCQSYKDEYLLDVVIVRPCHIYGPTMTPSDARAISDFIRSGVNGKDIVLKSKGEQVRSHCYVIDAAMGIFYTLIYGKNGEAYNISGNDDSICSIKEMAEKICEVTSSKIRFEVPNDTEIKGYSRIPRAVLFNDKLKTLGWTPKYNLGIGIFDTITILREANNLMI